MKMKEWLDRQVHEACVALKAQWAEILLKLVGAYLLFGGVAQPFITVVPHGTPEEMQREMIWATVGFVAVGACLLATGQCLTRRRKKKMTNQTMEGTK